MEAPADNPIFSLSSKLKFIVDDNKVNSDLLPRSHEEFLNALDDDLDTPKALAVLFIWIKKMNKKIEEIELSSEIALSGLNFLNAVDDIFGIIPPQIEMPANIQGLVNKRILARENKDWNESDRIRGELYNLGWKIEDTPDGSICKPVWSHKEQ